LDEKESIIENADNYAHEASVLLIEQI